MIGTLANDDIAAYGLPLSTYPDHSSVLMNGRVAYDFPDDVAHPTKCTIAKERHLTKAAVRAFDFRLAVSRDYHAASLSVV